MPAVDAHQHLWPEPLLEALARRRRPPFLRARRGGWELHMDGEPVWPVNPDDHRPDLRAELADADGLDLAIVAPSSPLGIESLPADEAAPLIDAYNDGIRDLPRPLRAWAAAGLDRPDDAALDRALAGGAVGLCLPAGAIAGPSGAERVAPLLHALTRRRAPLFVHPGPAPWAPLNAVPTDLPGWWPAMTTYVAQMHAAWLGFLTWVRPAHPGLRVCFAMLAGLAPLHHERADSRGVALRRRDPLVFYDTSSYGPDAVAAMAACVGADALVFGSDRPVVSPPAAADRADPARTVNPARLFALPEVAR